MKKILILGAGLVGTPMALDLAGLNEYQITLADLNPEQLKKSEGISNIRRQVADVTDLKVLKDLTGNADWVINAVPGFLGFDTLKSLIELGKHVIDISFFPENAFDLEELALKNQVTAITDMGVAPGMSNVFAGYAQTLFDEMTDLKIYVGGLPEVRTWPYEYKAGFSPVDVIEEYTRPAWVVRNGKRLAMEPLSETELMEFEGVGTLEAFVSDGLRSLAKTIHAPDMVEKTLRFPGHAAKMKMLRDTGFFNREPVNIKGNKVSPLDLSARLLADQWKLNPGERDITVMRIIGEGRNGGKTQRFTVELTDRYDEETGVHSMGRTTGYSATGALRMMEAGLFSRKGIIVPEYIGQEKHCLNFLISHLAERGIVYRQSLQEI